MTIIATTATTDNRNCMDPDKFDLLVVLQGAAEALADDNDAEALDLVYRAHDLAERIKVKRGAYANVEALKKRRG